MSLPTVTLPSGETIARLGQGTWMMGNSKANFTEEVKALQHGLDLGLNLIDTAEMYGDGGAEEVVGKAIEGCRDQTFIVSKVYPHNAGKKSTIEACERSLKRLNIDTIDLYLLHWRGSIPLHETIEAFETLVQSGKIRYWGVSNFDTDDIKELFSLSNGKHVQTNQVLYNLKQREMEWSLYPWCQEHHIPIMAYCPLGQGDLATHPVLKQIAKKHNAKASQITLAWLLQKNDVISIPKAVRLDHIEDNIKALEIQLDTEDEELLNQTFPPPNKPVALETV